MRTTTRKTTWPHRIRSGIGRFIAITAKIDGKLYSDRASRFE